MCFSYKNGYFYKCVSDGQTPATYSWENIVVQNSYLKSETYSKTEVDDIINGIATIQFIVLSNGQFPIEDISSTAILLYSLAILGSECASEFVTKVLVSNSEI